MPKFNQAPTITSPNGVIVGVPVEVTVDDNEKAKAAIQNSSAELGKIALDLSKQPGYEYLATLDKDNDINWVQVDLIQKNWDYTQEGLTPGAAALIAIAITIAAGPAGSGLTASMVATNAAGIALQTQAVITLINNKGDISKTLKDMASSDTIRNMATAALTAGLTAKLNLPQMANNDFANKLVNGVAEGATGAFVNAAVNGVSLEEALKNSLRSSLVDVFSAEIYSGFVKDFDTNEFSDNLAHKLVAAGVGCVSASAKKQDCDAGAIGAAVGEMLGDYLVDNTTLLNAKEKADILNSAKLLAGTVALITNINVDIAASSAGIAVENNALKQKDVQDLLREIAIAQRKGTTDEVYIAIQNTYGEAIAKSNNNWKEIQNCYSTPTSTCMNQIKKDYGNVRYDELKNAVTENSAVWNLIVSIEGYNRVIASCNLSPTVCLEKDYLNKVGATAPYMVIGGSSAQYINRSGYSVAGISSSRLELANLRAPNSRHHADKVIQGNSNRAKNQNTIIDRKVVDINADVKAIRNGEASVTNGKYQINGRTYEEHGGTLYPVSGKGFYSMNRGEYQALGVYNKFGNTPKATEILDNMNTTKATRDRALMIHKELK